MDDKDKIIIQQRNKICNLAGESERLRRERDLLRAKLKELENGTKCMGLLSSLDYLEQLSQSSSNDWTNQALSQSVCKRGIIDNAKKLSTQPAVRNKSVSSADHRGPLNSVSDGCLSEKLTANGHLGNEQANRVSVARHRSFKRTKEAKNSSAASPKDTKYELSTEIQNKRVEMLERKYGGGAIKTHQAAEIIQYNFRQYTLSKNFERLRNNRDETRIQRLISDAASEKDSVWSDVTVISYPTPMPLLDVEQHLLAHGCELSMSPVSYNSDKDFVCGPLQSGNLERSLSEGQSSGIGTPTVKSPPHPGERSGSSLSSSNIKALFTPPSDTELRANLRNQGDRSYSCQSSDSGDIGSIGVGGESVTYARNQSLSESRLLDVRVQLNPCSDKERKRQYRIGLNLFNKKPEKGIKYLMEHRFLENSSKDTARFLLARRGLSKQMIGDYLGNLQQPFNQDVLLCVVQELDLAGCEIDQALRKMINFFRLPGEAQKIERIVERFSQRYCVCNSTFMKQFKAVDTVFLISFAIIMLNTDLHNPNMKPQRKMRLEEFIKNLKGIDRGHDVSSEMLKGIYERISSQELRTGADHTTQVRKVEETMVGKLPPLVIPHRRLVCYCRLYEIPDASKKEKLGLHQREVFLFNDLLVITKIFAKKRNSITYSYRSSLSLSDILVFSFETEHYLFGIRVVSRIDRKPLLLFNARNQHDRVKFVDDLRESIAEVQEMDSMRIAEELQKHSLGERNRLSKDSGVVDVELVRPGGLNCHGLSPSDGASSSDQYRSSSLTSLDEEVIKRHSNGSVDSGMISTSTGSMTSREESPNFTQKNVTFAAVELHSPPTRTLNSGTPAVTSPRSRVSISKLRSPRPPVDGHNAILSANGV